MGCQCEKLHARTFSLKLFYTSVDSLCPGLNLRFKKERKKKVGIQQRFWTELRKTFSLWWIGILCIIHKYDLSLNSAELQSSSCRWTWLLSHIIWRYYSQFHTSCHCFMPGQWKCGTQSFCPFQLPHPLHILFIFSIF